MKYTKAIERESVEDTVTRIILKDKVLRKKCDGLLVVHADIVTEKDAGGGWKPYEYDFDFNASRNDFVDCMPEWFIDQLVDTRTQLDAIKGKDIPNTVVLLYKLVYDGVEWPSVADDVLCALNEELNSDEAVEARKRAAEMTAKKDSGRSQRKEKNNDVQ